MKRWDRIASYCGMAAGALLILSSLRMDPGRWDQPGPGFLPLVTAVFLVVLSLVYAFRSFREGPDGKESPWPKENAGKLVGVLAALFLFALVVSSLGFVLSTFALMTFLFRVVDPEKWPVTFLKAALSTGVTFLIFERWLMVQFPKGFLGI